MKNKFITLLTVAAALFVFTDAVRAQVTPTTLFTLTNANVQTIAANTLVLTTNIIPLTRQSGCSFQPNFNVSSGTAGLVFYIAPSGDNTNYATVVYPSTTPFTFTVNATGTTTVTGFTNWSPALLSGIASFNVYAVSNGNAGTFTNKATVFNRASIY
jgi:hypothetical protein